MNNREIRRAVALLEDLKPSITNEPLHANGRYFIDHMYNNLTSCAHGDTGSFNNPINGQVVALLWNLWRDGHLTIQTTPTEEDTL